jgi:NAD(P)-dependent dehydrogenase (short-subunit alcohol dehydrogenase family)
MDIRLDHKTAFVTGASRGIGRAIALEFAKSGANVVLASRSVNELEALATQIRALGQQAIVIACDLNEPSSLDVAVAQAQSELGPIDILVNNAGITQGVKFTQMTPELWTRIMTVNVESAVRLMQLTLDPMATKGWGRIINIASIAAKAGLRYSAAYNASKHALLGVTRSVALDYAQKGVTINAVCPGWVLTEMVEETVQNIVEKTGRSRDEAIQGLVKDVPLARMIEPSEVAALATFLASDFASAITGQGYNIDGGTVLN